MHMSLKGVNMKFEADAYEKLLCKIEKLEAKMDEAVEEEEIIYYRRKHKQLMKLLATYEEELDNEC